VDNQIETKAMETPKAIILIPTYNERENIELLIPALLEQPGDFDIMVVDDSSPDGTGELADELSEKHPRVHVLHRPPKGGLGKAILGGINEVLDKHYDYIMTMDADFSHDPKYVPAMLEGMQTHDLMIGSRYVPGGGTENWGFKRKLNSWAANFITRLVLWIPAQDCSAGFKCYRTDILRKIPLDKVISTGYAIQEELLYRYSKHTRDLGETPIVFKDRELGTSKMNLGEIIETLSVLFRLRLRSIFGMDR
jgi:dolichol-phosphate mannosyltransferase